MYNIPKHVMLFGKISKIQLGAGQLTNVIWTLLLRAPPEVLMWTANNNQYEE
jgi:hypothetical protein